MNKNDIEIYKSNELVQITINALTAKQNKILAVLMGQYIIGAVKNDKIPSKLIDATLTRKELLQLLEITTGGENYDALEKELDSFFMNQIVQHPEYKRGKLVYFDKFYYDEKTELVHFSWSRSIEPYLIGLSGRYTKYLQSNFLALKTKRSQVMYELMKSYQVQRFITISVEDLRIKLNATSKTFDEFKEFNKQVLKKAIKELNDKTDVYVSMKQLRQGRNVKAITFIIETNDKNIKQKWGMFENVYLSLEEYNYIVNELHAKHLINELGNWKLQGGKNKNDYDTIMKWYKEREKQRAEASKNPTFEVFEAEFKEVKEEAVQKMDPELQKRVNQLMAELEK